VQRSLSLAGERVSTLADVFRNPQLRRLELSWAGFYVGEWTSFVALSVYAFEVGGAAALGALGLVRMIPAAIALPFGSMLTDRYPRQRVLLGIHASRALLLAATAAALAAGSSRALVFALAALVAVAGAPERPATLSLVPTLARTPRELVATNVSSSTLEGLGTLVGPVLGGVVAATAGVDVAVAAAAAISVACALFVVGIRREGDVAGARRRVDRSRREELLGGVRTLVHEPHPRLIVLLFNSQTLVRGLLNVLLVVASIELLGMGEAGVGWLNAALGAGGLLGGLAAVGLVARRRLAGIFGLALVLWGAPIALVGAWPQAGWALVCLGVVGIGNALLDVSGFTLLQRTVDEHVLGRVFGVFEIGVAVAVAIGSVLGSILVDQLGIRTALVVTGAILPFLALLSLPGLRRIDDSVEVPERELKLVSDVPLFLPLPPTTLERLAARLERLDVAAGTTLVERGAAGDRFYLIAGGEIDVVLEGTTMSTLGAGDYFGEIALLREVPRTASCTARTDAEVYALDRDVFVAAVSGDVRTAAAAESIMSERLGELEAISGVGDGAPGQ
jgi:CRP-like cAMP-binding protein/predicted MFS family arabinose efflux permease